MSAWAIIGWSAVVLVGVIVAFALFTREGPER